MYFVQGRHGEKDWVDVCEGRAGCDVQSEEQPDRHSSARPAFASSSPSAMLGVSFVESVTQKEG